MDMGELQRQLRKGAQVFGGEAGCQDAIRRTALSSGESIGVVAAADCATEIGGNWFVRSDQSLRAAYDILVQKPASPHLRGGI